MGKKTTVESMVRTANKVVNKTQVTTSLVSSTTKYHKPKEIWVITLVVTTLEALKREPKEVRKELFKGKPKRALKEVSKKATLMDTRSTSKDTLRKALRANPRQHLLNHHQPAPRRKHS